VASVDRWLYIPKVFPFSEPADDGRVENVDVQYLEDLLRQRRGYISEAPRQRQRPGSFHQFFRREILLTILR